jgi:hypothetical protein
MAASKEQIREWVYKGLKTGATHVIIVYDRWDYEDYPVYVDKHQSVSAEVDARDGRNMLKVMEVYNLSMDIESQLNEYRAWHV